MAKSEEEGARHPVEGAASRLNMAAVLLVVVGVLGLATALAPSLSSTGEGLGSLLDRASADVVGQVKLDDGTPVEGAVVTHGGSGRSYTTGPSGYYSLEGLPTGAVELTMEAADHKTVVRTVHLERGTYVVDFVAEPGDGTLEISDRALPKAGDPTEGALVMSAGVGVASVLALLAAFSCWTRWSYTVALAGSLLGILTWGLYVGSALSLVATLLVLPLAGQFGGGGAGPKLPWRSPPPRQLEEDPEDEGEEPGREATRAEPERDLGGMGPVR